MAMGDPERETIVRRKLPDLVKSVRITDLLDHLITDNLIDAEEYEMLSSIVEHKSQQKAIRKLFVCILPRKPPGSFLRVLSVLERISELKFVAEMLKGTRTVALVRQTAVVAAERWSVDKFTAPPVASEIKVRCLEQKLLSKLSDLLDPLSRTDLDWRMRNWG